MSLLLLFQPPSAFATVSPAAAGVATGTNAVVLSAAISPASTGVEAGASPSAPGTAVGGFDSTSDILVTNATSELPATLKDPVTVAGWVRRTSVGNTGSAFQMRDASGGYNELWFTSTANDLKVGSNIGSVTVQAGAPTSAWVFVAMRQSGATRQLTGSILSGGSLVSQTVTSIDDGSTAVTGLYVAGTATFGSYVNGDAALMRVWTRVLSDAELIAEAASTAPVSTTNLTAAWPLADAATKLNATTGTALSTTGSGSWTTTDGPLPGSGLVLIFGGGGVSPAATGVTVGTQAPGLAANVSSSVTGVAVGTQAPTLAAPVAPSLTGVLAGTQTAVATSTLSVSATGVLVGTQAPALTSTVNPGATGVLVGAQSPSLSATISTSSTGVLTGTQAPVLRVPVSPSTTGCAVGTQAAVASSGVAVGSTGVLVGAQPASLSMTLTVVATGVLTDTRPAAALGFLLVTPTGSALGTQAPLLRVSVVPGTSGVVAGAWSASLAAQIVSPALLGVTTGTQAPGLPTTLTPSSVEVLAYVHELNQRLRYAGGFGSGFSGARRTVSKV